MIHPLRNVVKQPLENVRRLVVLHSADEELVGREGRVEESHFEVGDEFRVLREIGISYIQRGGAILERTFAPPKLSPTRAKVLSTV